MKIASVLLVLVATRIAAADEPSPEVVLDSACAVVEPSEILDETSRDAARRLFVRTLERAELLVIETGCTATWRLSHQRIDGVVVVRIAGPRGSRRFSNASPDKLAEIYEKLVRALLVEATPYPQPLDTPAIPVPIPEPDRETVAHPAPFPTPELPSTIAHGGLWTLRAGFGGASSIGGVTAGALGYRRNLGELAVDVSMSATGGGADGDSYTTAKLGLQVLRFVRPERASRYYGGGLSIGSTKIQQAMFTQPVASSSGGGFGLELAAGYAFARTSRTLQSFVQADVSLPFYTTSGSSQVYPATFIASVGLGFGAK